MAKQAELTPHQERIVKLVACGMSNREIAAQLGVTYYSVFNQMTKIRDKIGANNRTRITLWALQHKRLTVEEAVAGWEMERIGFPMSLEGL